MKVTLDYPDLSALCDDAESLLSVSITAAEKMEAELDSKDYDISSSLRIVGKLINEVKSNIKNN